MLTKRKGSHHGVIIPSIVHYEIAKLGGKAPFIYYIQNSHGKMRTVVLTVDIFQRQNMVFQLTVFCDIVCDYA